MDQKSEVMYMCGTTWLYEAGEPVLNGVRIHTSQEDAERQSCAEECGIVELEVRFIRWVRSPQKPARERRIR